MNLKNKTISHNISLLSKGGSFCTLFLFVFIFAIYPTYSKSDYNWQFNPKKIAVNDNLSIIFHRDQSSAATVIKIFFKGGKRAEPEGKRGLAYLTAGLIISIPDSTKIRKLMQSGSMFFSDVHEDYTVITIKCLSGFLPETLEVLTEVMKKPLFSSMRITSMKERLESRQKSEQEDPEQLMSLTALNAFFSNHGYSGSVYGDPASLKTVKKKDIVDFYKRYFNAANMTISISSDLDESQVKETIKRYFIGFPGGESPGSATPSNKESRENVCFSPERSRYFIKKETNQTLICFAALLPHMEPENFTLAFLLENLLGKGIGSRLWHLRMKHELAYGLEASLTQFRDAGILKIYIKTSNNKKDKAYQLLKNFIDDCNREGITAAELDAAKAHARADFLRMNETKEKRALHYGYFEVLGPGPEFIQDFFSKVDQITIKKINTYIKNSFKPENLVEIVIGPADITPATN